MKRKKNVQKKQVSKKIETVEKDEEEENDKIDYNENDYKLYDEEIKKQKCSLKDHEEIDAINYCQVCKIFMCNKCQNHHSQLFKGHNQYNLDENIMKLIAGICKTKNHNMKLEYYCENHNILCCAACIAKIKNKSDGKHKDCEIYTIEDIKDEKKNKLKENIKCLNDLSNIL